MTLSRGVCNPFNSLKRLEEIPKGKGSWHFRYPAKVFPPSRENLQSSAIAGLARSLRRSPLPDVTFRDIRREQDTVRCTHSGHKENTHVTWSHVPRNSVAEGTLYSG